METVIADAGPLVAYLKRDDKDHDWAADAFQRLTSPLRTCDAALGEAFFLLQRTHGGADKLLELLERGLVIRGQKSEGRGQRCGALSALCFALSLFKTSLFVADEVTRLSSKAES